MKVALVAEHYPPHIGGGEKVFADLARALSDRDVEVAVLTSTSGGVRGRTTEGRVQVQHFPWRSLFDHPIATRRDLAEHVRSADIVVTSQYTAGPAALAAAQRARRPCVFVAHEYLGPRWRTVAGPVPGAGFRAFERWIFAKPYDRFVAVSDATARDLIASGKDPSRVETIHPVFDDFSYWRRAGGRSTDGRSFLYYGRPGKTKGVLVLLEAIRRLDGGLPGEWTFHLILADEPRRDRREVIEFIRQAGLGGRVSIENSVDQDTLRERLAAAYCVVVPSLTEGFGFSAYQACCLGKNIIVSDAGSLPEVVSGPSLIFENGSAGSLSEAILRASRGDFEWREDRVARNGTDRMLALLSSLVQ